MRAERCCRATAREITRNADRALYTCGSAPGVAGGHTPRPVVDLLAPAAVNAQMVMDRTGSLTAVEICRASGQELALSGGPQAWPPQRRRSGSGWADRHQRLNAGTCRRLAPARWSRG